MLTLPKDLTLLSKTSLDELLSGCYEAGKPVHDEMVDVVSATIEVTAEFYKRFLKEVLPEVKFETLKSIGAFNCQIKPAEGIERLCSRFAQFKKEDIEITKIVYDETLNQFTLFTDTLSNKNHEHINENKTRN